MPSLAVITLGGWARFAAKVLTAPVATLTLRMTLPSMRYRFVPSVTIEPLYKPDPNPEAAGNAAKAGNAVDG